MTGENGYPVTPDWQLPDRTSAPYEVAEPLTIPPNIILGTE